MHIWVHKFTILTIDIIKKTQKILFYNLIFFVSWNKGTYAEFKRNNTVENANSCDDNSVCMFVLNCRKSSLSSYVNKLHIPQEILLIPLEQQVENGQP